MPEHTSPDKPLSLEDFAPITAALLREEREEKAFSTATAAAAPSREDVEPTPPTELADDVPDTSVVEQWRQREAAKREGD